MNDLQKVIAAQGTLYGAAYLVGCIVAGFLTGDPMVWKLGLAGFGFAYIGATGQLFGASGVSPIAVYVGFVGTAVSVMAGLLAGILLLPK